MSQKIEHDFPSPRKITFKRIIVFSILIWILYEYYSYLKILTIPIPPINKSLTYGLDKDNRNIIFKNNKTGQESILMNISQINFSIFDLVTSSGDSQFLEVLPTPDPEKIIIRFADNDPRDDFTKTFAIFYNLKNRKQSFLPGNNIVGFSKDKQFVFNYYQSEGSDTPSSYYIINIKTQEQVLAIEKSASYKMSMIDSIRCFEERKKKC